MERVGVLVHPTRPLAEAIERLRAWSEDHGLELVQIPVGEQPEVAPPGEVSACDVIAALGGDGTVLKALHAAASNGAPVLGVAFGSLGALTTIPQSELRHALDRFADGAYFLQGVPALTVETADGWVGRAVNDVVIARRGGTQLTLDICVNDELYVRIAGDGVVVATALGSSAYAMAAGGSLLASGVNAFVCAPVAVHGGNAPPLVIADDQTVTLEVHPQHEGFGVQLDGAMVETDAQRFVVGTQQEYAQLVRLDDSVTRLGWLRHRGLISDSPRVLARADRAVPTARPD